MTISSPPRSQRPSASSKPDSPARRRGGGHCVRQPDSPRRRHRGLRAGARRRHRTREARRDRHEGGERRAARRARRHRASPNSAGGMINAMGLANPGLDSVRSEHLPWRRAPRLGADAGDRERRRQRGARTSRRSSPGSRRQPRARRHAHGSDAYELNVSCPNVRAGGMEFGADPARSRGVVSAARAATRPSTVREALPGARRTSPAPRAPRSTPARMGSPS